MIKISVFGSGYVGLVTGVCFAEMGHEVTCVDIDENKVEQLSKAISPIYEPGLEGLLQKNLQAGLLRFTTDAKEALVGSLVVFIAVGTPPNEDGSADVRSVLKVAEDIASHMRDYKLIATKSTVPVGTCHKVKAKIEGVLAARGLNIEFDVCSNPEFLREGSAVKDCMHPSRVIVGAESQKAAEIMSELYGPFLNGNPLLIMDSLSSEMTKYAANAMLATRISLMNEFSRICEQVGADIDWVRLGIGADLRIGPHFLRAGVGYGGSCFPKDVRALIRTGDELGEPLEVLKAVVAANSAQQDHFFRKIDRHFEGRLDGHKVAIWGVSFKPGTDDIREAPALHLIEKILKAGGHVSVFDPVAEEAAKRYFSSRFTSGELDTSQLEFCEDQYEVLVDAEVLLIVTEWESFREPSFDKVRQKLKFPVIFDGRNIYSPKMMKERGFTYSSIGRPS